MRSKRQMMRGKGKRRGDAGSIVLLSWLIPVTPVRSLPLREGRGVGFPVFLSGCSGGGGATLPTTPTQGPRKDRQRRSVPLLPSLPLSRCSVRLCSVPSMMLVCGRAVTTVPLPSHSSR